MRCCILHVTFYYCGCIQFDGNNNDIAFCYLCYHLMPVPGHKHRIFNCTECAIMVKECWPLVNWLRCPNSQSSMLYCRIFDKETAFVLCGTYLCFFSLYLFRFIFVSSQLNYQWTSMTTVVWFAVCQLSSQCIGS